jgi:hypothetical protein
MYHWCAISRGDPHRDSPKTPSLGPAPSIAVTPSAALWRPALPEFGIWKFVGKLPNSPQRKLFSSIVLYSALFTAAWLFLPASHSFWPLIDKIEIYPFLHTLGPSPQPSVLTVANTIGCHCRQTTPSSPSVRPPYCATCDRSPSGSLP